MKKTISIIAAIILMVTSGSLFAQDKANELLANLAKIINSHKNIELIFTYQISDNPKDYGEELEGRAYLQGESYAILLQDQHTISDGKTVWTYWPEDEEAIVSNFTENDESPSTLFAELQKDGSGRTTSTDTKGNTTIEIIESDGSPSNFFMQFDKKGDLKKVHLDFGSDGGVIMNIKEIIFDQDFKDSLFRFDKSDHPDVEIIDMR